MVQASRAASLKAVWGPAMLTNLPAHRQAIGVSTFAGWLRMVHQSYQPIPGFWKRYVGLFSHPVLSTLVRWRRSLRSADRASTHLPQIS
jgi:hypothetical protein